MVNFSNSDLNVDVKAGAAKTKYGPVPLWGGFDPLGFKVWSLSHFPSLCFKFLSLLSTFIVRHVRAIAINSCSIAV